MTLVYCVSEVIVCKKGERKRKGLTEKRSLKQLKQKLEKFDN